MELETLYDKTVIVMISINKINEAQLISFNKSNGFLVVD